MRRRHGKRARLGGALLVALGALAMLALPSFAAAKDRNHDHIPDRWEKRHHLSLHVNQAARDQDSDHLGNRGEFQAGDNPRNSDSDGDGVMDGEENAGTIASFDPATGKLTITLFGGETVSGIVNEDTGIQCGRVDHPPTAPATSMATTTRGPPASSQGEKDDPPGHDGTPPGASEGPGQGAENTADCTTAALVVGATVDEAELELGNGVATFEKIELEQTSGATS